MIALLTLQDNAYRNQTAGFWGALMRNQPLVQHAGGQVQRAVTTVTHRRISNACIQRAKIQGLDEAPLRHEAGFLGKQH